MTVEMMQEMFDYCMENGVVVDSSEMMEAIANGVDNGADLLDYVVLVMPGYITKEELLG